MVTWPELYGVIVVLPSQAERVEQVIQGIIANALVA
jgi:hypothetical protein